MESGRSRADRHSEVTFPVDLRIAESEVSWIEGLAEHEETCEWLGMQEQEPSERCTRSRAAPAPLAPLASIDPDGR